MSHIIQNAPAAVFIKPWPEHLLTHPPVSPLPDCREHSTTYSECPPVRMGYPAAYTGTHDHLKSAYLFPPIIKLCKPGQLSHLSVCLPVQLLFF